MQQYFGSILDEIKINDLKEYSFVKAWNVFVSYSAIIVILQNKFAIATSRLP